jgi:hypothetical protein
MKKIKASAILSIVFGVIAILALFSMVFLNNELEKYSQSAALSVNRTEKSLVEFELLIEEETSDYSYYRDIAQGFLPSFNYHLYTGDDFVIAKYKDFYWDKYTPVKDSMRTAIANFTKVTDQEDYEKALKDFKNELENFGTAVDYLENKEFK